MNKELSKILTLLIGGFLVVAALIYLMNHGFGLPEPVAHAKKEHPHEQKWSFDGPMGTFDKQSVQRGYQVYKEVCASCHSMNLVTFRTLKNIGFSEGEVKSIAAEYTYPVVGEDGSMTDRKGIPSDHFKAPYENKESAGAANGGAVPPDLSLMAKAREDGPNYIYSILTGYHEAPADVTVPAGKYYNPFYSGQIISMPKPLSEGQVTYEDGTKASVEQMSHDVVNFLQWTAEPEMEIRKRMGIKVIVFLSVLTVFFYIAKRKTWKNVH